MSLIKYLQSDPKYVPGEDVETERKKGIKYDMIMDIGGTLVLRAYCGVRDVGDFFKENFCVLKNRFYSEKDR